MFCFKCGSQINDGMTFCPNCGANQNEKGNVGLNTQNTVPTGGTNPTSVPNEYTNTSTVMPNLNNASVTPNTQNTVPTGGTNPTSVPNEYTNTSTVMPNLNNASVTPNNVQPVEKKKNVGLTIIIIVAVIIIILLLLIIIGRKYGTDETIRDDDSVVDVDNSNDSSSNYFMYSGVKFPEVSGFTHALNDDNNMLIYTNDTGTIAHMFALYSGNDLNSFASNEGKTLVQLIAENGNMTLSSMSKTTVGGSMAYTYSSSQEALNYNFFFIQLNGNNILFIATVTSSTTASSGITTLNTLVSELNKLN